jgi:23S rRNA pseudouridine2605 synthase
MSPPSSPLSSAEGERIAKFLARAGVCSRRDAEKLIEEGRVKLNGKVLNTPAVKVTAKDKVSVDGRPVSAAEETRLWRYHKPSGLVTTHKDPAGRPTVFERLPDALPRVISVGRLDLTSEGLLLLTNDGALARRLELPSSGLVRRYRARAYGRVEQTDLDKLKDGITVEGVRYGSIEAKLERGGSNSWINLSLTEGKNREVRRVLEALGLKVNRLIRIAYGPFQLGTLEPGAVEEIPRRVLKDQLGKGA